MYAVRTQFGRILNTFMYFWNKDSFLQIYSTGFDQAFYGGFYSSHITVSIIQSLKIYTVFLLESDSCSVDATCQIRVSIHYVYG